MDNTVVVQAHSVDDFSPLSYLFVALPAKDMCTYMHVAAVTFEARDRADDFELQFALDCLVVRQINDQDDASFSWEMDGPLGKGNWIWLPEQTAMAYLMARSPSRCLQRADLRNRSLHIANDYCYIKLRDRRTSRMYVTHPLPLGDPEKKPADHSGIFQCVSAMA